MANKPKQNCIRLPLAYGSVVPEWYRSLYTHVLHVVLVCTSTTQYTVQRTHVCHVCIICIHNSHNITHKKSEKVKGKHYNYMLEEELNF